MLSDSVQLQRTVAGYIYIHERYTAASGRKATLSFITG